MARNFTQLQSELTRLQILLSNHSNMQSLTEADHRGLIRNASIAVAELQESITPINPDLEVERHISIHDGEVHDPLGAGSYVFRESLISSIIRSAGLNQNGGLTPQTLIVHIGAQPNNSPHAGTLVVFFMGFLIAKEVQEELSRHGMAEHFEVKVHLDLVDTAPDPANVPKTKGKTVYQKSLRFTEGVRRYEADYDQVLKLASEERPIEYEIRRQADLTSMECFPDVIERVVKNRETLGPLLAPDSDKGVLAIRAACPYERSGRVCGLADKHGIHNEYTVHPSGSVAISFLCPKHGRHAVSTSNPAEVERLEFNTPLRNLVRGIAYAVDTVESRKEVVEGKEGARERIHIRVTGSDYAGLYTDQMLWRAWLLLGLPEELSPPVVLYAPLIVDWAGSKLSKSLYVESGAYRYLEERGMDYLLSFAEMQKRRKDPLVLFRLVESWVQDPKKIFRSYSVDYLHMKFSEDPKPQACLGTKLYVYVTIGVMLIFTALSKQN